MAKVLYSNLLAGAGFSGETFDIAAGGANTDIINVLLSAGNGALTDEAPHVLFSTGSLFAGGVTLDISGMENESTDKGTEELKGRFFYLSVQNSNISATNKITVNSSVTINGLTTLDIMTKGDYLFHYSESGVWRCNELPTPAENPATLVRIPFASTDWDAATNNTIVIKASGTIGAGQVGPHLLTPAGSYVVQIINTDATPDEMVDVEIQFASNGDITLKKASKGADFNGVAVIVGSLD